jgi:hypothetical protein
VAAEEAELEEDGEGAGVRKLEGDGGQGGEGEGADLGGMGQNDGLAGKEEREKLDSRLHDAPLVLEKGLGQIDPRLRVKGARDDRVPGRGGEGRGQPQAFEGL